MLSKQLTILLFVVCVARARLFNPSLITNKTEKVMFIIISGESTEDNLESIRECGNKPTCNVSLTQKGEAQIDDLSKEYHDFIAAFDGNAHVRYENRNKTRLSAERFAANLHRHGDVVDVSPIPSRNDGEATEWQQFDRLINSTKSVMDAILSYRNHTGTEMRNASLFQQLLIIENAMSYIDNDTNTGDWDYKAVRNEVRSFLMYMKIMVIPSHVSKTLASATLHSLVDGLNVSVGRVCTESGCEVMLKRETEVLFVSRETAYLISSLVSKYAPHISNIPFTFYVTTENNDGSRVMVQLYTDEKMTKVCGRTSRCEKEVFAKAFI